MERRYDEILTTRLEDAVLNGCTHITWTELYRWYGVEKIAARTYRDLHQRFIELKSTAKPEMIEGRGGIYLFDSNRSRPVNPDA